MDGQNKLTTYTVPAHTSRPTLNAIAANLSKSAYLALRTDRAVRLLSGVSIQRNARNARKKVRNKRNERNSRKNRKLQPIGTELSSFQLNSSF